MYVLMTVGHFPPFTTQFACPAWQSQPLPSQERPLPLLFLRVGPYPNHHRHQHQTVWGRRDGKTQSLESVDSTTFPTRGGQSLRQAAALSSAVWKATQKRVFIYFREFFIHKKWIMNDHFASRQRLESQLPPNAVRPFIPACKVCMNKPCDYLWFIF